MIQCKACGQEHEGHAAACSSCQAPLRENSGTPAVLEAGLGWVCVRCEVYNEPGAQLCTGCGLSGSEAPAPPPEMPPGADLTITSELRALSLSDAEAAEAAIPGPLPASATRREAAPAAPPGAPAAAAAPRGAAGPARRDAIPAASASSPTTQSEDKPCASCGVENPPAANFCFECGRPFAGAKHRARTGSLPPSIEVDALLLDDDVAATTESARLSGGNSQLDVPAADSPDDTEWLPFQAKLVVEKGNNAGAAFPLARRENAIGSSGTAIELKDDPFVAPLAATLMFVEERLAVRDEGSVNGVFVALREATPLRPGDHFIAGERLFRFDGSIDLPPVTAERPLLGAPRPGPRAVRVVEVLAGGRTGRTCHRAGPSLTIGRSACDMNFPADALLAPRHAEIHISEDGAAALADLRQGASGVLLRVREREEQPVQGGDLLQIGDQRLRIQIG